MGKTIFVLLAACLVQAINCGKFGPFGPFGPYAPGANGMGLFGAAPPPFGDPLMQSQVAVNQFLGTLRMSSMEFGRQIGQINALTGKQISQAKLQMNAILVQNKNEIKAAQNNALLQGINIDSCVNQYNNATALVSVKDLKLCANSQEMFDARANMGKLKLLQSKAKNTVQTCQLQFPSPLQVEDVDTCVTGALEDLTNEFTTIRDNNSDLLINASESSCIADTQTKLQDAVDNAVNDFQTCTLDAPAAA